MRKSRAKSEIFTFKIFFAELISQQSIVSAIFQNMGWNRKALKFPKHPDFLKFGGFLGPKSARKGEKLGPKTEIFTFKNFFAELISQRSIVSAFFQNMGWNRKGLKFPKHTDFLKIGRFLGPLIAKKTGKKYFSLILPILTAHMFGLTAMSKIIWQRCRAYTHSSYSILKQNWYNIKNLN